MQFGLALRHSDAKVDIMNGQRNEYPSPVPDYTGAFLASFGVLVFMALFAIWAIWGLIMAGIVSWLADRLITIDFRRRSAN